MNDLSYYDPVEVEGRWMFRITYDYLQPSGHVDRLVLVRGVQFTQRTGKGRQVAVFNPYGVKIALQTLRQRLGHRLLNVNLEPVIE